MDVYPQLKPALARNASDNVDILYKCTIDEIRLRVISGLQENLQVNMNIHELCRIDVYAGSQARTHFCVALTKIGRVWEVVHCSFMISIVTLHIKLTFGEGDKCVPT